MKPKSEDKTYVGIEWFPLEDGGPPRLMVMEQLPDGDTKSTDILPPPLALLGGLQTAQIKPYNVDFMIAQSVLQLTHSWSWTSSANPTSAATSSAAMPADSKADHKSNHGSDQKSATGAADSKSCDCSERSERSEPSEPSKEETDHLVGQLARLVACACDMMMNGQFVQVNVISMHLGWLSGSLQSRVHDEAFRRLQSQDFRL